MNVKIFANPGELTEGFFGQILLYPFRLLADLDRAGIRPEWALASRRYGCPPGFMAIPGILDLAYVPEPADESVHIRQAPQRWPSLPVDDWQENRRLFDAYFRIPERILSKADLFPPCELGLHYRGTDKQRDLAQTNPVAVDEFLSLAKAFAGGKDIRRAFVASDEPGFIERVGETLRVETVSTGTAWGWSYESQWNREKGDHAVLDCLLLSRCRWALKCQSALSGFAKVLNPNLEIYKVAAARLVDGISYFPDAYIPVLQNDKMQGLIDHLMRGDWRYRPREAVEHCQERPRRDARRHMRRR